MMVDLHEFESLLQSSCVKLLALFLASHCFMMQCNMMQVPGKAEVLKVIAAAFVTPSTAFSFIGYKHY